MKYTVLFLIFTVGFAVGRWSARDSNVIASNFDSRESCAFDSKSVPALSLPATADAVAPAKPMNPGQESKLPGNTDLARTDDKARDKYIRQLFTQLMDASEKNQVDEQNRLFREMESLNPRHETVFQARAMFLQDDEDWQGAHAVLKECVAIIPNSLHCLRRLANIRSSSTDEKIRYGLECLQISKNDPLCLVDVAMALHSQGEFAQAKDYFETALHRPSTGEGYYKDFMLYHYGHTLESLQLHSKAKAAFTEACQLKMKAACEELRKLDE